MQEPLRPQAFSPAAGGPASSFGASPRQESAKNNLYVRVDYFDWRESEFSIRLLEETGPLVNLGYLRRTDAARFRAEFFGGAIHYDGATWDGEPITATSDYLGFRVQYDLLVPLACDPHTAFTLGLGTRLWNRNLHDGQTILGDPVYGYDETWWSVYPVVGLETRRPLGATTELVASATLGWTGFTYQWISEFDASLYPKMGPMAQAEIGLQGPRLSIAASIEWMQWYASGFSGTPQVYQPESRMFTIGLSGGYRF